eukprot:TRINITY_DN26727_c0_g1_i2.p1 TRINITY_DN26727_c0_g1~~TRINITY_DN26727_c0_g1_i2.p1  ORF type:complete len:117 (-),score=15.09 TRINITY_DN26727_c0_g1_i2:238-588(-)
MQRPMLPFLRRSKDAVLGHLEAHGALLDGCLPISTPAAAALPRKPQSLGDDRMVVRRTRRVRFDLKATVVIEVPHMEDEDFQSRQATDHTPQVQSDPMADPFSYSSEVFERYPPPC